MNKLKWGVGIFIGIIVFVWLWNGGLHEDETPSEDDYLDCISMLQDENQELRGAIDNANNEISGAVYDDDYETKASALEQAETYLNDLPGETECF